MLIASLAAASNSYRLEAGITLLLGALLLVWEAKAPDSAASIVGASCRCSAAARLAPPLFCSAAALVRLVQRITIGSAFPTPGASGDSASGDSAGDSLTTWV